MGGVHHGTVVSSNDAVTIIKALLTDLYYFISVILIFAGYHIYLGSLLPEPFLMYYISGLMIPIAILASSFVLSKEVHTNWCRTKFYTWKNSSSSNKTISPRTGSSQGQGEEESTSLLQQQEDIAAVTTTAIDNPYSRQKISIHLHHWQIFYVLAFFTR